MASKSKRARINPERNFQKIFVYWSIGVFVLKLIVIARIVGISFPIGGKPFSIDGIWLGADGENYLTGYNGLLRDGVFSAEGILNYWPAGYPLVILLLSKLGASWVLTTLSIVQTIVFSLSAYFFAVQLSRTRLKKYSFLIFLFIIFNPTLSLSSLAIGYESFTASGFLFTAALIVKDFTEKNNSKFKSYVLINAMIYGLLAFMQPRLLVAGILILCFWIVTRCGVKAGSVILIIGVLVSLIIPASLMYRNYKAIGVTSISTNLGVTMSIGAGNEATGGYGKGESGVDCNLSGTEVQKDNQRVRCVLAWYLSNPVKSLNLFYNKSIYFWSPWFGPEANGTMARNPWLKINPVKNVTSTQEGVDLVFGGFGKLISWVWLLSGVAIMFYGYLVLLRQKSLERFIGNLAMIAIGSNWLISLISIGDHRFRIPIMGMSLFLQAVGLKTLLRGGKPAMVDGPALR
jgi:hypothetical protein